MEDRVCGECVTLIKVKVWCAPLMPWWCQKDLYRISQLRCWTKYGLIIFIVGAKSPVTQNSLLVGTRKGSELWTKGSRIYKCLQLF